MGESGAHSYVSKSPDSSTGADKNRTLFLEVWQLGSKMDADVYYPQSGAALVYQGKRGVYSQENSWTLKYRGKPG